MTFRKYPVDPNAVPPVLVSPKPDPVNERILELEKKLCFIIGILRTIPELTMNDDDERALTNIYDGLPEVKAEDYHY